MTGELERVDQLLNPVSGELTPATPQTAAELWVFLDEWVRTLTQAKADCVWHLANEGLRIGKKTLHLDGYDVKLTGGEETEYDAHELMAGLMEHGCPPDRINEAVTEIVSYKVNKNVLRQLRANPGYAEAIDQAAIQKERPWRATVTK